MEKTERPASKKKQARAELAKNLDVMVQTVAGAAVLMRGPHWQLSDEERANVTGPLAELIDSMSDSAASKAAERIQKLSAPIALIFAVSGIVGSRLVMEAQLAARARAEAPLKEKGLTPNVQQPTGQTRAQRRDQQPADRPGTGGATETGGGTPAPAQPVSVNDPHAVTLW